MTDSQSSSRNVSYDQVKILIDFMGQHVDFAAGTLRSLEARHTSKTLWTELTRMLNNSSGTKKSVDGWSKYWSDFKNKLKHKVSDLKKKKKYPNHLIKPLSRLEKRALVILGPQFERKISKVPIDSIYTNYPTEVKLEGYNGNGHNSHTNNLSGSSDRQSEFNDESNDSEESNEEYDDNLDDESEPILHGLYPNWLVEMEQKRVEADLARAKAEEQRANTAARNSEAALIQAEAFKKLADAAVVQADALAKIADILDNNGLRQIVPF